VAQPLLKSTNALNIYTYTHSHTYTNTDTMKYFVNIKNNK